MPEILDNQWFSELVNDCKSIIVESSFSSRWALLEGYHQLGERIIEAEIHQPLENIIRHLSKIMKRSERTLYYAVKFARQFPDINNLPDGKATSWNRVVTRYLTEHSAPPEPHTHNWEDWRVCQCGHKERVA